MLISGQELSAVRHQGNSGAFNLNPRREHGQFDAPVDQPHVPRRTYFQDP